MCCKKWLKNIYKLIVAGKMRFIKLTTKIINSVIVQIILAIIGICLLIKFFPDKVANLLGIQEGKADKVANLLDIKEGKADIMSFIELIIEGIFCILVLKEFKMTRKSFEWQKREQEEKKDKEADFRLYEIAKYFLKKCIDYKDDDIFAYSSPITNIFANNDNIPYYPDSAREEFLLQRYNIDCYGENIETQEIEVLKKIVDKIILNYEFDFSELSLHMISEENFLDKLNIGKGSAKIMELDYDMLEKIYNNIFCKKYAN